MGKVEGQAEWALSRLPLQGYEGRVRPAWASLISAWQGEPMVLVLLAEDSFDPSPHACFFPGGARQLPCLEQRSIWSTAGELVGGGEGLGK